MQTALVQTDVRPVTLSDLEAISRLHALAFGPGRFVRTAYRLREGIPQISPYCRLASKGNDVIAAVRMTRIAIGGAEGGVLLGPLAVHPTHANQGHGRRLVAEALQAAQSAGEAIAILVGNTSYYGRFGFVVVPRGQMTLPGPVDPGRLLAAELQPDALQRFSGRLESVL